MLTTPFLSLFAIIGIAAPGLAHPGEDHTHEAAERAASLATMGKRSLSHCADKLAARGIHARNAARRRSIAHSLARTERAKRDLATVVSTSHHSNLTGVTPSTDAATLFGGSNQCILGPDTTQGPYYVTGEYYRANVTESQGGVPIYVDIQIIDTNTCEPLPNVALDYWHCNATGVYSGVVANGNGDSSDGSNLNATFLRGIQATDADGVVQFQSIVPGHYTGRANHVHILAHTEGSWSLLANNTITGGTTTSHVGQLFFDQDLLSLVEATAPYSTNTAQHTQNSEDNIMSGEAATIDPVLEYVLLGDTVEEGLFAWISMGINATASSTVQAAANYGESGGVANANGGMGGGGDGGGMGGPGGNGTAPPGGMGGMGGNNTASGNATAASDVAAVSGTSSASSIFSMSIPLAIMAAALRLARV